MKHAWIDFNKKIISLSEKMLEKELKFEKENLNRTRYKLRIHQRLTKVRAKRERKELLK